MEYSGIINPGLSGSLKSFMKDNNALGNLLAER